MAIETKPGDHQEFCFYHQQFFRWKEEDQGKTRLFGSEGDQAISEVHGVANQEVALPEAGKEHCTGVL